MTGRHSAPEPGRHTEPGPCTDCGHHRGSHFREGCDADLQGDCRCKRYASPPEPGPGDPVKGRHAVTPATVLGADILAWEADAAAHARVSASYRAADHSTPEIIEHVTGQLTEAGHLLSRARMLFLMAAPDIPRAQR